MNTSRSLSVAEESMPKALARAYLVVVGFVWLGHVVALISFMATGRASWTTQDPGLVVPAFVVIASAVAVVRLVDRRLVRNGPGIGEPLRLLGLAYGRAVPAAWRRLRG
jgi:hypothetical protein